jgi:hypothetical protein
VYIHSWAQNRKRKFVISTRSGGKPVLFSIEPAFPCEAVAPNLRAFAIFNKRVGQC